jgi:hypothetical protein
MCRNFTYEVVEQRRRLKAIKKIVAQKLNAILFFDIEFFKYFFRVLHEASRSWLKFLHAFQKHPVLAIIVQTYFFYFFFCHYLLAERNPSSKILHSKIYFSGLKIKCF